MIDNDLSGGGGEGLRIWVNVEPLVCIWETIKRLYLWYFNLKNPQLKQDGNKSRKNKAMNKKLLQILYIVSQYPQSFKCKRFKYSINRDCQCTLNKLKIQIYVVYKKHINYKDTDKLNWRGKERYTMLKEKKSSYNHFRKSRLQNNGK